MKRKEQLERLKGIIKNLPTEKGHFNNREINELASAILDSIGIEEERIENKCLLIFKTNRDAKVTMSKSLTSKCIAKALTQDKEIIQIGGHNGKS